MLNQVQHDDIVLSLVIAGFIPAISGGAFLPPDYRVKPGNDEVLLTLLSSCKGHAMTKFLNLSVILNLIQDLS